MNSEIKKATVFSQESPLQLDCGLSIGPIEVAYEDYGTLNADKSNAILICHALSGDSHVAGQSVEDPKYTGWWDNIVGPNKVIDTTQFYVLCSNVIGGCKGTTGPGSTNPKTNQPYGLDFPVITIRDMVKVQNALVQQLGISKLKCVIGGSMGGMQAIEWAITFPEIVEKCLPIAATSRLSPQALAFDAVGRHAILTDPKWNNGNYYQGPFPDDGLSVARMIGHITYLSEESMNQKFGRNLQNKKEYTYNFETEFQVESYLKYQGDKFATRFDPNSYLYLTKAISYFDLEKQYGSLEKAFEAAASKFLIISISSDWLYPPKQSKEIVKTLLKLNKRVSYCDIHSPYGHDAFLLPNDELNALISSFIHQEDPNG